MKNWIFIIRQDNRRPQRVRVRSITPEEAAALAYAMMNHNGKAAITYWAEQ